MNTITSNTTAAANGQFGDLSEVTNGLNDVNQEDFFKLLDLMSYKRKVVKDKELFIYQPKYIKKKHRKIENKDNPFDKLSELRFR